MHSGSRSTHRPRAIGRTSRGEYHRECGVETEGDIAPLVEGLISAMAASAYTDDEIFETRLALEEAVLNAIKHGHGGAPGREVLVRYHVNGRRVLVIVEDQGDGFDPERVADPLASENLHEPGGRGLLLMRSLMTCVRHNRRGNRVTLCKRRHSA
jgi:serine/threonine-protein kinase RsbW